MCNFSSFTLMCFVKHIVIQMRRKVSYTYTYGFMYQPIICMICVPSIIFQITLSAHLRYRQFQTFMYHKQQDIYARNG